MKNSIRLGCLAAAATAATGLLAAPATAAPRHNSLNSEHAVFVQTDEVNGNHVAAYRQARDGSLTLQGTYATGGTGGILPGSVIDHTASQGAVTYDREHRLLFVVNAGSDSLSVFGVDGARLKLRQVLPSGGTFPVSVDVHDDVAYVANAQNGGSVQGYRIHGRHVTRVPGWNRPLGLDATLTHFTQTPGQVAFSPDGSQLLVTTKANGHNIEVFALDESGAPSATPVVNNEAGTVPFALTFEADGTLAVAAAGPAAVITYRLGEDGVLTQLQSRPSGQRGTCWVVRAGKYLFTTNPGAPSVTTFSTGSNGALDVVGSTPTDPGTVDPAVSADGHYLYVETGAQGVVDQFRINADGTLTSIGSVTVANAAGAEGIAAS